MYSLINNNCQYILNENSQKLVKHFKDYLYLLNKNNWQNKDYKGKYKAFWGMNAAMKLSSNVNFYTKYFDYLLSEPSIPNIDDLLGEIKKTDAGFQFSFATKAVHILNPDLPIYDVNVRRFYFLNDIKSKDWEEKHEIASRYYSFLQKEYKRVISENLLIPAMNEIDIFLERNNIDSHNLITQTKKIDSIIWAWVDYLNKRNLLTSQVSWQ